MMDYVYTAAGGILLGVSALLLLGFYGKIAGISGIARQSVLAVMPASITGISTKPFWALVFILGMVLGGAIIENMTVAKIPTEFETSTLMTGLAGLLVGMGTYLANGCTSGHGICGIGRLSKRSIVATCIFMFTAIVTVFLVHSTGQALL
ncbi:MAG: YeeE/YedE family protein [Vibrio sp.]